MRTTPALGQAAGAAGLPFLSRPANFFRGFWRGWQARRATPDPRELSPHLQRDLGLLDGNPLGHRHV